MPSSSEAACSRDTPGRRRPTTCRNTVRLFASPGRVPSAVKTSTPRGKANPAGSTPITVKSTPVRVRPDPTTPGSAPRTFVQNAWVTTTVGWAPSRSSAARKVRPRRGGTARASKNSPVTRALSMVTGSPRPVSTKLYP